MDYVYHGSKTSGLKKVEKRVGTHRQEWVYATLSKALSILFINKGEGDLSYVIRATDKLDDPIILVERKPDTFKEIFNLAGSLYTLSAANFTQNKTKWIAEVISSFDEDVITEEYIPNVWQRLKELESLGKLQIYLYPNRPDVIPLDNSDLIPKVIAWDKNGIKTAIPKFLDMYPELTDKFYEALNNES
ncbi:MAG TPA: hypothetical protein PLX66_01430 [Bacilli bacterium]|nr:hypothetical protein [Bacilli bacterium]